MSETVIVVLIILLIDVAVVAGLLLYAKHIEGRLEAVRTWGQASGVITAARLKNQGKGAYVPAITYDYTVGGTKYSSSRIQFGAWETGRNGAEAFLAEHPVGAAVSPRYDPDKPSIAVLRATGNPKMYRNAALLVGLSFIGVAVLIYFVV